MNINEQLEQQNEYLRKIVAQNEAQRRLKIKKIERNIEGLKKQQILSAITVAVSAVTALAISLATGQQVFNITVDPSALSAGDFQNFIKTAVPPELVGVMGTSVFAYVGAYFNFLVKRGKRKKAENELDDLKTYSPKNIEDEMIRHEQFETIMKDVDQKDASKDDSIKFNQIDINSAENSSISQADIMARYDEYKNSQDTHQMEQMKADYEKYRNYNGANGIPLNSDGKHR